MKKLTEVRHMGSPSWSLEGWNLWEYIKGRKHLAITLVGGLLGYIIFDDATVAVASGAIVELVFAVVEYYIKKRK